MEILTKLAQFKLPSEFESLAKEIDKLENVDQFEMARNWMRSFSIWIGDCVCIVEDLKRMFQKCVKLNFRITKSGVQFILDQIILHGKKIEIVIMEIEKWKLDMFEILLQMKKLNSEEEVGNVMFPPEVSSFMSSTLKLLAFAPEFLINGNEKKTLQLIQTVQQEAENFWFDHSEIYKRQQDKSILLSVNPNFEMYR